MRACETGIMTMTSPTSSAPERVATHRSVLMCRPTHFTVSYRINPWMHPEDPTDTSLAVRQWETLYAKYQELGFDIHLIDPVEGLPDMVYAANGGYVLDGKAFGAKFEYPERQPEGPAYMDWFRANGFDVREPVATNEGEGDMLLVGETIYAGTGFRTDVASHDELRTCPRHSMPPRSTSSTSASPTRSSSPTRTRRCSASTASATERTSSSHPVPRTSSASSSSADSPRTASTCPSCCSGAAA
jgi:hypothetical protein